MSTEAVAWALRADLTGTLSAEHRLVLVTLADHARPDGTGAWPAVATIAHRLGCAPRSVQRALKRLESLGLIKRGDQRMVSHLPGNRRPTVWTLRIGARIDESTPQLEDTQLVDVTPTPEDVIHRDRGDSSVTPTGVTPVTSRGDTCGTSGVTAVSPKPRTKPSKNTNPPTPRSARQPSTAPGDKLRAPDCGHGTPNGTWTGIDGQHPPGWVLCPACRRGIAPPAPEGKPQP